MRRRPVSIVRGGTMKQAVVVAAIIVAIVCGASACAGEHFIYVNDPRVPLSDDPCFEARGGRVRVVCECPRCGDPVIDLDTGELSVTARRTGDVVDSERRGYFIRTTVEKLRPTLTLPSSSVTKITRAVSYGKPVGTALVVAGGVVGGVTLPFLRTGTGNVLTIPAIASAGAVVVGAGVFLVDDLTGVMTGEVTAF